MFPEGTYIFFKSNFLRNKIGEILRILRLSYCLTDIRFQMLNLFRSSTFLGSKIWEYIIFSLRARLTDIIYVLRWCLIKKIATF